MTAYLSALSDLTTQLIGTGANLTNSLSEIPAAARRRCVRQCDGRVVLGSDADRAA